MWRTFRTIVICLLLGGMLLPAAKKDTKQLLDDVAALGQAVTDMQQKLATIAADTSAALKKIETIEEKVNAVARTQADLNQSKENFQLSFQYLKEELNDIKNTLNKMADRLTNIPTVSQPQPSVSQPTAAPATPARANGKGEPAPAAAQPAGAKDGATAPPFEALYYSAYSDYLSENYALAVSGFRQFLNVYPDNGLADNALYWIGECHYAQKKYADAVSTFNELIAKYEKGDKVPAALLKRSYAQIEMGRQAEGVNGLKELVSRFPLSDEAKLAKQKLQEMSE